MFNEQFRKYRKALVLGTGGGNDIVSAIFPAMHLQKYGIQTDLGGMLSPAAIHTFNGNLETVVNAVEGEIKRSIPTRDNITLTMIDSHLPPLLKAEGLAIPACYNFSIRYGTKRLVQEVTALIKERGYDLVVAVDVGGDILGRGAEDITLLSPMMDFSSLHLLGQLAVDSFLIEFGLGTDGELRPQGMKEIMHELKESNLLLEENSFSAQDAEFMHFKNIFDCIKDIRAGHTAVMTLETLKAPPDKDIITPYRFRSQIGKKKWLTPFEVILPHQYFGKSYLINAKGLAAKRSRTAFAYENSLEHYVKLKQISPSWKTEMDLFYIWSGDQWTTPEKKGNSLFFLVPSRQIPAVQRKEILEEGMHSPAEIIMILEEDRREMNQGSFSYCNAGMFSLLFKRNDLHDFVKKTAEEIKRDHM